MSIEMLHPHRLSDQNIRLADIEGVKPFKGQSAKIKLPEASHNIYDPVSGCIIQKMTCLRCNCTFKADLQTIGLSFNLLCPYCGREDQLRACNGLPL